MSALLNVPMVGDPYDQQHSNTHQRAYLRLHSLREAMTIPRAAVAARSIARSRPVAETFLDELSQWLSQPGPVSDEEVRMGLQRWVPEYEPARH